MSPALRLLLQPVRGRCSSTSTSTRHALRASRALLPSSLTSPHHLDPPAPALTTPRLAQTFTTPSSNYYSAISKRSKSTMADQKIIYTENAPFPLGPYSQAIHTPFAIFCSGQIPLHADGTPVEGSIADKTRKCCENLDAVLKQAGSSLPRVVKTTIFLSSMDHFAEMNAEYGKFFPHKPARSCVAAKTLPKGVDVEIEAIALP